MYAQLTGLQAEFLRRKVPFRVLGQMPFFQRREISILLSYLKLALRLHQPVGDATEREFLAVANVPSRMLNREVLRQAVAGGKPHKMTFDQVLGALQDDPATPLSANQRSRVGELQEMLRRVDEILVHQSMRAAELLGWLVTVLNYYSHFDDYYGRGESSEDRKRTIGAFLRFAESSGMAPEEFIKHLDKLDTTLGAPEESQIVMTTIFRTKGLEFDYVVIPDCAEGYLPSLMGGGNPVFDTAGQVQEPEESEAIENERRLFYVAITRARQIVLIGAPDQSDAGRLASSPMAPSRFLEEMQLAETVELLKPVVALSNNAPNAKADLLAAARRFGGRRRIVETLVNGYLARSADPAVIGDFMHAAYQSPEMPFSYAAAYASQEPEVGTSTLGSLESADPGWGGVLD
jgi:DNA helicase-2/ATP-dependent DNA helicase PcrA